MKISILQICLLSTLFTGNYSLQAQMQWASSVSGKSSEYSTKEFAATQVLGKPNAMPVGGSSPVAWSPYWTNAGKEWIEVAYAHPIHVAQVAIAESYNPGAITKIILIDTKGKKHVVYQKKKPKSSGKISEVFRVYPKLTSFLVKGVKVELNTQDVPGYNHIDAIGISEHSDPIEVKINLGQGNYLSKPENLGSNINSKYGEVHPLISPDGKVLYFTRKEHPENMGTQKRDDIWFSRQNEDGNWGKAINIGPPLNSPGHNFINAISPDGNMALIGGTYMNYNQVDHLYLSYKQNGQWTKPEEIKIDDYYNLSDYNSFHLGSDGKTLLMSVKRNDSYGSKDLYVSFLKADNSWTAPKNLGNRVNTAGDEVTPFLAPDGKTLYFSSNGFPGFGSNDIYKTTRLDNSWQNWSEPENVGDNINTPDWDAYYTVEASGEFAYFASYENAIGEADIFRIRLQESQKPEAVTLVSGLVRDATDSSFVQAKILYNDLKSHENVGFVYSSSEDGSYQLVLAKDMIYDIEAQAEGYYSVTAQIDLTESKAFDKRLIDLWMYPIQEGNIIPLNNIFFEANESSLLETSYYELNHAVEFLKTHPGVVIEVAGHTNNLCSASYCKQLSEDRAKAVADYLISHGITSSRVHFHGYGKEQAIESNDTEQGRKKNQRVELRILKI